MQVDEALSSLVRARGQHLVRVAYQLTHNRAAAEDVVQEALLAVCRSWRVRHGQPERLEAYVRRAILNGYLKRYRRERGAPVTDLDSLQGPVCGGFDSQIVDRDQIWRLLGTLSARQRAVLVLRFYEELPDSEIAAALGCRPATVRSMAARGLAALRAQTESDALLAKEPQP